LLRAVPTRRSDAIATIAPAPAQTPSMAATIGCGQPRIVGQGRAAEWIYSGRALGGEEAERWGFYNRLVEPDAVLAEATAFARQLADGPAFAHSLTKSMLHQEWSMDIDTAIDAEATAQALCMLTEDFGTAYRAFAAKSRPVFEGR